MVQSSCGFIFSSSSGVDQLDTGHRPLCPIHCVETIYDHESRSKIISSTANITTLLLYFSMLLTYVLKQQ